MRGLFGAMVAPRRRGATLDSGAAGWLPFLGSVRSATGIAINQATAMRCAAVFGCITIPAEDVARASPRLYRRLPDRQTEDGRVLLGGREEVTDHPLARLFLRPNRVQDWYQFAGMMERSIGLKSNAYALVLRDRSGVPTELLPFNPDKVIVLEAADGSIFYQFAPTGLFELSIFDGLRRAYEGFRVPAEHVFHMHELGFNMLLGTSRIGFAAEAVGLTLGQEQQAGRWIGNGARPSVVLTTDGKLTPEAARRIKQDWEDLFAGLANTGRTAVLEQGLKPATLTLTSVDLEFLASRSFQVEDICRFFRMPPTKLAKTDRSANMHIAAQDADYTNNTLAPKFTRWERRLDFHFGLAEQGLFVDFDLSDLFRADPATRFNQYRIGILTGFMTVNEVRIREGLPPVEGGDVLMSPVNMAALGSNLTGTAPDGAGRPAKGEEP